MAAKKQVKAKYCVITNKSYGIYVGLVDDVTSDPNGETKTVKAREVRHVARWYGKSGGITSLAVHGLCGPDSASSRIGAPSVAATLGGIVNIFECSAEARATFEAAKQS
jgi:hypothetical protein